MRHDVPPMSASAGVWNRACAEAGATRTLTAPGDRALADMILAHSLAMNGGLLYAIETRRDEERVAAAGGYRYFGLNAAAEVLDLATSEQLEIEADERDGAVVPDDGVVVAAFEAKYAESQAEFATLN